MATTRLARYDGNRLLPEALERKLGDPAGMVRVAAVTVAQGLKRTPGVEPLLLDHLSRESEPRVFEALGRAYRARGVEEEGLKRLLATLAAAEGVTAEGAAAGLRALTGQEFGTDAWAWRDWAARRPGAAPAADDADAGPTPQPPAADAGPAPAPPAP
jgi:hypothetical protein